MAGDRITRRPGNLTHNAAVSNGGVCRSVDIRTAQIRPEDAMNKLGITAEGSEQGLLPGRITAPTAAAPEPDAGVIDMQRVIDDLQIDEAGYLELVAVFLDEAPRIREAMARALEQGREALIRVTHELGTTFGVVGATRGQDLARGLERALRAGEPVDLPTAAASLLRELEATSQTLQSKARGGVNG
jgi:HPt (histidine-containing phosphotransfer) domain-containing protein